MSVAERKEREKEQRRSDIIDAAEKLFFSGKFDDVSMDDIAKAVDLSRATLYLYFQDKESIYHAVILRGVRIMNDIYMEILRKNTTGADTISAIGYAFIRFHKEHADYYRLFQYAGSQRFDECDNEYLREVNGTMSDMVKVMCRGIAKGIEDGTIRNDLDPLQTAIFLMNTTENALNLSPNMKSRLEKLGISHEQYLSHCMKLMGYAITNENGKGV
jgi:TetR/AcrR family transcriptional regulator